MSKKCIVIGGGIIGLCTAYYLAKSGHRVTVIDRGGMNSGASYVNAGYITPSHIIPLSSPGIITKGIKWMLHSSSPFYVKPRLDKNFLQWAWAFKKSATPAKVERAIPIIKDINLFSRDLYEDIKQTQDFTFSYQRKGLLMCYKTAGGEKEEHETAEVGLKEGMNVMHLSANELNQKFPSAGYNVKGAYFYESDAHMTPNEFMGQLTSFLNNNDVVILKETEVEGFKTFQDKIISVQTSIGDLQADEVILAAGSWTGNLAKKLKISIPIEAGKGYSFNIYRDTGIVLPSILAEAKVAVTPMVGFTRFAGTMELGGINDIVNPVRVEAIANAAKEYFNGLTINKEEKESATSGLRPCSPDGLPFIGRFKKWKNLSVGAGHAMMGWSLGPATGKLLTEIIDNKKTSLDLTPFNPDRKF